MKNVLLTLFVLFTLNNFSQTTSKRIKQFNVTATLAIQGYDPVAYFKTNKAVKGKKEFALVHEGITYHFTSKENKDEFQKAPQKYEPQYGGWCAYAMGSSGEKVEINPETFKIIEGKLYLFYNAFFNNTLKSWNKDEKSLKAKADSNWKKFM
jgi:YHS domain-containing protein